MGKGEIIMKKISFLLIVIFMFFAIASPILAHPRVPEQSLGNVSINSAKGMGTAYHGQGNISSKGGIAAHVFEARFMSVFHP
jgi:hypothetical protein